MNCVICNTKYLFNVRRKTCDKPECIKSHKDATTKAANKKWREKNREHINMYRREYYEKNKARFRDYEREWRAKKRNSTA